jgi:lysophospholipase L1-like esterase
MKKFSLPFLIAVASVVFFTSPKSFAQVINVLGGGANTVMSNAATNPVPLGGGWVRRHDGFVAEAKKGGIDILFMGDSITDFWRNRGSNVWNQYYAPQHAANFGISGDRTEHVLWRMNNGELDGIKPKVVVLMIGTNNTGKERNSNRIRNTTPQVIEGVTAVVNDIRAKLPESKILLLAIFPRGDGGPEQQAQINEINPVIAKLADGKMVTFLDIGAKFLNADGKLPTTVMPDLLHPNEHGYQIWADAMNPTLAEMMK